MKKLQKILASCLALSLVLVNFSYKVSAADISFDANNKELVYAGNDRSDVESAKSSAKINKFIDYRYNKIGWNFEINANHENLGGYITLGLPKYEDISDITLTIYNGGNKTGPIIIPKGRIKDVFDYKESNKFSGDKDRIMKNYVKGKTEGKLNPYKDLELFFNDGRIQALLPIGVDSLARVKDIEDKLKYGEDISSFDKNKKRIIHLNLLLR